MAQLRSVTCHMGSHSVTCYPTQVNTPRLNPSVCLYSCCWSPMFVCISVYMSVQIQRSKMTPVSPKLSSHTNSRKSPGRTSPSLKTKNFFTRYIDILNTESSQSPAASVSHESVSCLSSQCCYNTIH